MFGAPGLLGGGEVAFLPGNGERRDAAAFALQCRGGVRLFHDGKDCTPKSRKGRALLAVLAAEQRPLSRVKIVDLLWSDRQEEQARGSLRTLLADFKEQFGSSLECLLVIDRERVALAPGVRSDLADEPMPGRPCGDLFEDLDHIDPQLDNWLRVERERRANKPNGMTLSTTHTPRQRGTAPWLILIGIVFVAAVATLGAIYL